MGKTWNKKIMNFEYHLQRLNHLLRLNNIYLKERKVNKIRRIAHLIETFSNILQSNLSQSNLSQKTSLEKKNWTEKEISLLKELRKIQAMNKAILLSYKDISNLWLQRIKQGQLTYDKDGKRVVGNKMFYSTTA